MRTLIALAFLLLSSSAMAHKGIFIVRHAEKASATDPDTPLAMQGEDRALALARLLRSAGVSHVFASHLKRTQQTVEPLVEQRGLTTTIVHADKTAELLTALKGLPPEAVAVVAGHSNTIPDILKGLGITTKVDIKDDQYGRVFLVTGAGQLIELSY
jgi:phosphohistidine phosphatase SixA